MRVITVMGIKARTIGFDLDGVKIETLKIMKQDPRRVGGIEVDFDFPGTLQLDEKQRAILERAALTCPVANSIHPDIELDVHFGW